MPDAKITALTAISVIDPAVDPLPIVDVSDTAMAASGTTKKITINQILGASGTATLAAATITGDLTVDTNTFFVDAANNRVSIGTATPNASFEVKNAGAQQRWDSGGATDARVELWANSLRQGLIGWNTNSIVFGGDSARNTVMTWQDIGGVAGTAMTLNSTGLGIGVTPSAWGSNYKSIDLVGGGRVFTVSGTGTHGFSFNAFNNNTNWLYQFSTAASRFELQQSGNFAWLTAPSGTAGNAITFTQAMTLTAAGNLAVGVAATGNRLDVQNSTDCTVLVKSTGANANVALDYISNYGNHTIRKSGTAVWDFGVINDASATPAFKVSNASSVGVQLVSGATSWTTLSDETMKDIIEPISNAVSKVGSLRSVIGKFKTDDSSKRRSFLIAQDVQSVLPEAVDVIGENNELGLRYTEVIPLLVAAIKELTARVQTLETR